jgi:hypothetical protein
MVNIKYTSFGLRATSEAARAERTGGPNVGIARCRVRDTTAQHNIPHAIGAPANPSCCSRHRPPVRPLGPTGGFRESTSGVTGHTNDATPACVRRSSRRHRFIRGQRRRSLSNRSYEAIRSQPGCPVHDPDPPTSEHFVDCVAGRVRGPAEGAVAAVTEKASDRFGRALAVGPDHTTRTTPNRAAHLPRAWCCHHVVSSEVRPGLAP